MNWNDLRIFLAVARAGTMAKAGTELRLDQTTVARKLKQLEFELGALLFYSTGGRKNLTSFGKKILAYAETAEASVTSISAIAQNERRHPAGNAIISAPGIITRYLLVPHIGALQQSHPEITIELNVSHDFADLTRMEADIAVRMQRPSSGDFALRQVGTIQYSAYQNRQTKEQKRWIGYSGPLNSAFEINRVRQHFGNSEPAMRTNDPGILVDVVRDGSLAAVIPTMIGDIDPLLERMDNAPVITRDVWIVTRMDMKDAAHIKAVTAWLAECFRLNRQALQNPSK